MMACLTNHLCTITYKIFINFKFIESVWKEIDYDKKTHATLNNEIYITCNKGCEVLCPLYVINKA